MCSSPPMSARHNEVNTGYRVGISGVVAPTSECIDGWPSGLLDLGDDARRTSRGSHHVCKGLEWAITFGIRRRRFPVVGVFSKPFALWL